MNDSTDYMDFLRPLLPKLGEIEGITEEEIADLECRYKVVLPEAYKQYMRIFGRKNGKMLQGENMCIDMLENILESYQFNLAHNITADDTLVPIGDNWYFFGMRLGMYYYFECDGNPDPKVWMMPALDSVDEIYSHFTDFVKEESDLKRIK